MRFKELPYGQHLRTKWHKIQRKAHSRAWNEFEPFYNWAIKHGYGQDRWIQRIDGDKPWGPGNCRIIKAQPTTRDTDGRAESWDRAMADFRRRLAWAEANDPAAIDRLLSNGVPIAKKAAPGTGTSEDGKANNYSPIIATREA